MGQDIVRLDPQLLRGIVAVLACTVFGSNVQAGDYRFGDTYRYYYPNGYYRLHDRSRLRRDMRHLDDQIRKQQWQLETQADQQQEQTRLLRQQQSAQQQLTAMQACYYRFNGGLDLCERLFDVASDQRAECVEAAKEINPGCAADIVGPDSRKHSAMTR